MPVLAQQIPDLQGLHLSRAALYQQSLMATGLRYLITVVSLSNSRQQQQQ